MNAEAGAGAMWGVNAQGSLGLGFLADERYQDATGIAFAEGGLFAGGPGQGVGLPKPDYSDYVVNAVFGAYAGGGGGIWISNATGPAAIDKQFQAAAFNLSTYVFGGISVGLAFNLPYYVFTFTYSPPGGSVGVNFTSYPTWTEARSF